MKSIFLILILASSGVYALPAAEVLGPNIHIKRVIWTWTHRSHFLQSCLTDLKVCGKSDSLLPDLQKINQLIKDGQSTRIQFASEKENPELFKSGAGEVHRIAVTGNTPGSPITFNSDRIQDLTIAQIIAIQFHELAHHIGLKDDSFRLPDQIGARLAQHSAQQLRISYLDEDKAPNLQAAVFQFALPKDIDGTNSFGNFGYVTDGILFIDLSFNSFDASPPCDRIDAFPLAQVIDGALSWTAVDTNSITLMTPIKNFCVWIDKENRKAGSDIILRGFKMVFQINQQNLIDRSTITTSLADTIQSHIDKMKTLQLIDFKMNQAEYSAGDDFTATVKIRSLVPINPTDCQVGITHELAPKQDNGWPLSDNIPECQISGKENDIFTLQLNYKLSKLQLSGLYSLALIKLSNSRNSQDIAFGTFLKNEMKFSVKENLHSSIPINFMSMTAPTLPALPNLGTYPLQDSYFYTEGTTWPLEIKIKSKLKVSVRAFWASFFVAVNGELGNITQGGELKDLKHYILTESVKTEGDYQVITLLIKLPSHINKLQVLGLSVSELYIINEAKNYYVIKKSNDYQYLYMSEKLLNKNP